MLPLRKATPPVTPAPTPSMVTLPLVVAMVVLTSTTPASPAPASLPVLAPRISTLPAPLTMELPVRWMPVSKLLA